MRRKKKKRVNEKKEKQNEKQRKREKKARKKKQSLKLQSMRTKQIHFFCSVYFHRENFSLLPLVQCKSKSK